MSMDIPLTALLYDIQPAGVFRVKPLPLIVAILAAGSVLGAVYAADAGVVALCPQATSTRASAKIQMKEIAYCDLRYFIIWEYPHKEMPGTAGAGQG